MVSRLRQGQGSSRKHERLVCEVRYVFWIQALVQQQHPRAKRQHSTDPQPLNDDWPQAHDVQDRSCLL